MKKIIFIFLISLLPFALFSQRKISGRVIKAGGGGLTAAKIYCKEAPSIFTFSDDKGNYILEVPKEVTELVFSYSGMRDKTVTIKEINNINAVLVPSKFKKFRFGFGFSSGVSSFHLEPGQDLQSSFDTAFSMSLVAISGNVFFRFHNRFDLQLVVEDGLNKAKIDADSTYVNSYGDVETVYYTDNIFLNRVTVSLPVNCYFPFGKTGNYSFFAGLGPQFQHLSFLNTNAFGLRIQSGFNINEYGFTTKMYLAFDISSGSFGTDNQYVPGLEYSYFGFRFGAVLIFK